MWLNTHLLAYISTSWGPLQETQLIGCGRHAIEACHENMQAHVQYMYSYAAS